MINRKKALFIRKSHRYLGLFIGIQFLFWTVSGLYFSWTNIDEIHGDQFHKKVSVKNTFPNLISPTLLKPSISVESLELKIINGKPYYWINHKILYNAISGIVRNGITVNEALLIAKSNIISNLEVKKIELIKTVDEHHEYREKLLPAYVISYNNQDNLKVYISQQDGKLQTIRHRSWRWFDFLWMTHTMDYQGRDNINNILLRIFSALGLITVLSGFLLWFTSSPTIRKFNKKNILKPKQ